MRNTKCVSKRFASDESPAPCALRLWLNETDWKERPSWHSDLKAPPHYFAECVLASSADSASLAAVTERRKIRYPPTSRWQWWASLHALKSNCEVTFFLLFGASEPPVYPSDYNLLQSCFLDLVYEGAETSEVCGWKKTFCRNNLCYTGLAVIIVFDFNKWRFFLFKFT